MANAKLVLPALSVPARVAILERLAERPMAVGELAELLPITRPAVSQHLKVLRQAELVDVAVEGTRRVYRIDLAGLGALRAWLDQHWERALAGFAAAAEQGERK